MLNRSKLSPPMYLQIADKYAKDIEKKVYVCGDIIPSENQISKEYEVSRTTARLALIELENMGYVDRKRGKGTQVIMGKLDEQLKEITSFTDEMKQNGVEMITSFCDIKKIVPNQTIGELLGTDSSSNIFKMERIRMAQNKPVVYSVTYLNIEGLSLDTKSYEDSLYRYLKKEMNIIITKAEDQLEAIIADQTLAKYLAVKTGSPIFMRKRKGYSQFNTLVEYSISYYPGERYQYSVVL
jgi:GntR family transcriptional regulator